MQYPKCRCPHHKVFPIFIVLFGLLFLLEAVNVITPTATNILWPIIVIAAGLQKLFEQKCSCCGRM